MTDTIRTSITELRSLGRDGLVARWNELFDQPPPSNLSVQLLRSGIAYELQTRWLSGLGRRARDELKRVAVSPTARPARQPRAGAQLMREWNGVPHIVDIIDGGFLYRGKNYKSLTAIAREITGARWSGPRFFGLRPRAAA